MSIGAIRLAELGIKTYIFPDADMYEYTAPAMPESKNIDRTAERQMMIQNVSRQRQRDLAGSLAMILVGTPLYLYHWKTIQKEKKNI